MAMFHSVGIGKMKTKYKNLVRLRLPSQSKVVSTTQSSSDHRGLSTSDVVNAQIRARLENVLIYVVKSLS